MSLFLTALGVVLVTLTVSLIVWAWPRIRKFYMDIVQPWVDEKFSRQLRDHMDNIFCPLNEGMIITRRALANSWNFVRKKIVTYVTRYRYLGNGKAQVDTKIGIRKDEDENKMVTTTTTQVINFSDLPTDLRNKILESSGNIFEQNNMDIAYKKTQEKCDKLTN